MSTYTVKNYLNFVIRSLFVHLVTKTTKLLLNIVNAIGTVLKSGSCGIRAVSLVGVKSIGLSFFRAKITIIISGEILNHSAVVDVIPSESSHYNVHLPVKNTISINVMYIIMYNSNVKTISLTITMPKQKEDHLLFISAYYA